MKISIFPLMAIVLFGFSSGSASGPPKAGETAPDFVLPDTEGNVVRLSEAVGDGPTLLVFYRGHW
ncbi:MAG: hypothetical protein R3338_01795 [Thermoanaerobaculia bacterium]|nr:hypothetical protein [Thermoanaerobaculia bacterium]